MKPEIIVTTSSPHRSCAGVIITGAVAFPADKFTAEQLHALMADRFLTVVVGHILKLDDVDDFVATHQPCAEPEPKAEPAKGVKAK